MAVNRNQRVAVSHYGIQYSSFHRPQLFLLFPKLFPQCQRSPLPINIFFLFVPVVLAVFFGDFVQVAEEFGG